MAKSELRPASQSRVDAKNNFRALVIFGIAVLIIAALFFIPFGVNSIVGYPHYYFIKASGFWRVLGFVSLIAWFLFAYIWAPTLIDDGPRSDKYWISLVGILVFMVACFGGWVFPHP